MPDKDLLDFKLQGKLDSFLSLAWAAHNKVFMNVTFVTKNIIYQLARQVFTIESVKGQIILFALKYWW